MIADTLCVNDCIRGETMSDNLPVLQVQVLDVFAVTYGDKPLSFGRNTSTKALKLLQVLLYYSENGIAREKLIENLYGREELADAANNLRVTVHRLKKLLMDAGMPDYDYINIKKGIYRWQSPMEVKVDALEMKKLIEASTRESDREKQIEMLETACRMYRGTFLPDMAGADWALVEDIFYKNLYSDALKVVCDYKLERSEFDSCLSIVSPACEMYPFDEWQSVKIDCYIGLNRHKDALKEYEATAKLFFEELGISPSEKMMKQFEKMSSNINYKPQDIKDIKNRLKEVEEESGAFYCTFPSFRDSYRLVTRIIERNGQSVYLMLLSLTNGKGQPMENEEKLELMSQELHKAIKRALRRGDSFTKYSPSQYVLLLVGTNKENCGLIYDRIAKNFCENHKTWTKNLDYYVSSAAAVESNESKISFGDKIIWN